MDRGPPAADLAGDCDTIDEWLEVFERLGAHGLGAIEGDGH